MDARRTLALAFVIFATVAGRAFAQAPVLATNGSALDTPANLNLPSGADQCLARPYIGLVAGQIQFINTGQTTCMWWSTEYGPAGTPIANTYVPRGAGAVTNVRVRSGPAPAPLQFAILGSGGGLCCTTKTVSPAFAPAPDQVNEFAVNLPAGSGVGDTEGSQYNDILVVSVAGPGSLPVNDRGAHGFIFDAPSNQARAAFLHPALANGASNTDVGVMDGYEVLLQYDWCGVPMTGSNPRPVAPADPTTACLPGTGAPGGGAGNVPVAPAPLRIASPDAVVRANRAAVRLVCQLTTACTGKLRLVQGKSKTLGTAKLNIKAGKAATVRVPLNAAGRKAFKRKRKLAVSLVLPQGRLPLTLKR
jgi:hypothetical protein